jgi:CO/xanthine dehydrogenase FAD-binding subunit
MISEYHRPTNLAQALELLARPDPITIPLGGGSALQRSQPDRLAVVDLQALGLNSLRRQGNFLQLGATLTLQSLLDEIDERQLSNLAGLKNAILHDSTYNLRQVGTIAGALVSAGGRSPFAVAMLALDASLALQPGDERLLLGELLPLRHEQLAHRLITSISIPLNVRLSYEYVARSPADLPIVCAAAAIWSSGRVRLALGGFGAAPMLAFDAPDSQGIEHAASSAYSQAGDEWASAEYRQQVAAVLAVRCVAG